MEFYLKSFCLLYHVTLLEAIKKQTNRKIWKLYKEYQTELYTIITKKRIVFTKNLPRESINIHVKKFNLYYNG